MQELLEGEGYRVLTAENGAVGLALAKVREPSVILLDLMMPVMDGYTFLEELVRWKPDALEHTPVLVVTAAGDRTRLIAGVRRELRKPVDVQVLLEAVAEAYGAR